MVHLILMEASLLIQVLARRVPDVKHENRFVGDVVEQTKGKRDESGHANIWTLRDWWRGEWIVEDITFDFSEPRLEFPMRAGPVATLVIVNGIEIA